MVKSDRRTIAPQDRGSLEALLLEKLEQVNRMAASACRRYRLSTSDTQDFASIARIKLIENDYRILARFECDSSWDTYLRGVIENLLLDFVASLWGKWRPSKEARRLGVVAIHLEKLIYRDACPFDQAVETLKTNHGVGESADDLHAMYERLPSRVRRTKVASEEGEQIPTEVQWSPDFEREGLVDRLESALRECLCGLTIRERLVLRMRFKDGFTLADISRLHGTDQKKLYRDMEKILRSLRSHLETAGISAGDLDEILTGRDWALDFDPPAATSALRSGK